MAKLSRERQRECERLLAKLEHDLPEYEETSRESAAKIRGLLARAGVECGDLPYDEEGLARVEALLHEVAVGTVEVEREAFERLVGYFLARCLIERAGGRWAIHDVCTERWRPYIILHVGDKRVGVFRIVELIYAKGATRRRRRPLSKLFRDLVSIRESASS